MPALINLPGTNMKPREVEFFHSVTGALFLLRRDKCATTSGNDGAINIWVDDDGKYRGCRMRWMNTESEMIAETKSELKAWLIKEMPLIKARDQLSQKGEGEA